MAYVLHRTPCCRSIWELKHGKGGGEKKDPFFMKITYLGDGGNPVNFLLKKINAFGETYDLDESSINKMTLDGTEIKFENLTLANKGEYGGTTDIYTYTFNDTNEHELVIYSDSLKILRFTGLISGPDASDKVRFKNIKSVDINNVTIINAHTFFRCTGLTSVTIPNSVTSIGNDAFSYCSGLTSITIPNSVTSIGNRAFSYCSGLTEVNFNATNCTEIKKSTGLPIFYGCSSFTTVNIGNNVETIPDYIFWKCTELTEVTIPDSVTSIGNSAFGGCTELISITSLATTAPTIQNYTFQNVKTDGTLTVPSGSTGYDDTWMQNANYYLGLYNWTKVEQ